MYTLEELRQTTPTGTPFQKELAKALYGFCARKMKKAMTWFNSW